MKQKTRKRKTQKRKTKTVVGYIYAVWCGHCKALKPVWKQMKKILPMHLVEYEEVNSKLQDERIAEINRKYGVNLTPPQGYPYIFKIDNGKVYEYNGNRSAKEMAAWFRGGAPLPEQQTDIPSGSQSVFGQGMFRGGIKTKSRRRRGSNESKDRTNKRRTQKSWFWFA